MSVRVKRGQERAEAQRRAWLCIIAFLDLLKAVLDEGQRWAVAITGMMGYAGFIWLDMQFLAPALRTAMQELIPVPGIVVGVAHIDPASVMGFLLAAIVCFLLVKHLRHTINRV